MKERAIIYLRKSRALGDADDPNLLAAHKAAMLRLAEADGVEIAPEDVIEEIGSGESLRERPRFRALLEWMEETAGAGGRIYVPAEDRLSRGSLSEVGRIVDALIHARINVRTPQRLYDLTQPDDELFYAFLAALSRHELGRYKARAALKRREMVRLAQLRSGNDRFGYRWDRNLRQPVPVEPQFSVAKKLFAEALETSVRRLAARYGLPVEAVSRILHNPVYCGWPAQYQKTKVYPSGTTGRRLPLNEWTWPEQPGDYPAACTREQFLAVQAALARREHGREKRGSAAGWCRDVLGFEGREGERLVLGSWHWGERRYLTYRTAAPPRLHVHRELVHGAALAAIRRVFADPDFLAAAKAEVEAQARATPERDPAGLRAELEAARRRHDELLRRELDVQDTEERASIARVRAQVRDEIAAASRRLSAALPAAPALPAAVLAALPAAAGQFDAAWEGLSQAGRRALANAILRRIVVRVTPAPPRREHHREVIAVDYQAWVPASVRGL